MENIFVNSTVINKINTVILVKKNTGDAKHANRSFHGVVYYVEGTMIYRFANGKQYRLCGGEVLYLPKGSSYEVITEKGGDCIAINFLTAADGEVHAEYPPFKISAKSGAAFFELFKAADKVWNTRGEGFSIKTMSLLYDIAYNINLALNAPYRSSADLKTLNPALSYIAGNYCSENISVEKLARLCKISSVHLRKLFKGAFNLSPVKYINSLKIKKAAELLESGMYSVRDTAFMTGYEDESYFSRAFKKSTGLSPRGYIKQTPYK